MFEDIAAKIELGLKPEPKMEQITETLKEIILDLENLKSKYEFLVNDELVNPYDQKFQTLVSTYEKVFELQELLLENDTKVYKMMINSFGNELVRYSRGVNKYSREWSFDVAEENLHWMMGGGVAGIVIAIILTLAQLPLIPLVLPVAGMGAGAYIKREGYIKNQKEFQRILLSLNSLAKKAIKIINEQNESL